jgi:hypothetical protein
MKDTEGNVINTPNVYNGVVTVKINITKMVINSEIILNILVLI